MSIESKIEHLIESEISQRIVDELPIEYHPRCHGFIDCIGKLGIYYLFECIFGEE